MDVAIHTSHDSLVTHAKNNVQPLTTKRIDSGHAGHVSHATHAGHTCDTTLIWLLMLIMIVV